LASLVCILSVLVSGFHDDTLLIIFGLPKGGVLAVGTLKVGLQCSLIESRDMMKRFYLSIGKLMEMHKGNAQEKRNAVGRCVIGAIARFLPRGA